MIGRIEDGQNSKEEVKKKENVRLSRKAVRKKQEK